MENLKLRTEESLMKENEELKKALEEKNVLLEEFRRVISSPLDHSRFDNARRLEFAKLWAEIFDACYRYKKWFIEPSSSREKYTRYNEMGEFIKEIINPRLIKIEALTQSIEDPYIRFGVPVQFSTQELLMYNTIGLEERGIEASID